MTCHDNYDSLLDPAPQPVYVVGIDGSAASAAALRWAVSRPGAREVRAVYVFHASNGLPVAHPAQDLAESFVAQALPEESWCEVHSLAIEGEPRHVLVELSREADVLVLGASHRTAFGTRVLGSTSSICAAHAACPVMVVPEAWSPRSAPAVTQARSSAHSAG